jgi:hypothetical protein
MDQNIFGQTWKSGETVLRVVIQNTEAFGEDRLLFGVFSEYNELGALGLDCTEKFFWINPAYIQSVEALRPREVAKLFRSAYVLTRLVRE